MRQTSCPLSLAKQKSHVSGPVKLLPEISGISEGSQNLEFRFSCRLLISIITTALVRVTSNFRSIPLRSVSYSTHFFFFVAQLRNNFAPREIQSRILSAAASLRLYCTYSGFVLPRGIASRQVYLSVLMKKAGILSNPAFYHLLVQLISFSILFYIRR